MAETDYLHSGPAHGGLDSMKGKRQKQFPRNNERGAPPTLHIPSQNKSEIEISESTKGLFPSADRTEPRATARYPLFESVLQQKGLKMKGIYTVEDAREIFGTSKKVSRRTIQDLISSGELPSRKLPGTGRFLADDFETYLRNSVRQSQQTCTK